MQCQAVCKLLWLTDRPCLSRTMASYTLLAWLRLASSGMSLSITHLNSAARIGQPQPLTKVRSGAHLLQPMKTGRTLSGRILYRFTPSVPTTHRSVNATAPPFRSFFPLASTQ